MGTRSTTSAILLTGLLAVILAGCGQAETRAGGGSGSALGCEDGAAPIRDLLRTEIPAYDYDPYVDLAELIEASDQIVTGTLHSVQRIIVPEPEDPDGRPMLKVTLGEAQALTSTGGSGPETFAYDAVWALRNEPDPLADPVTFDTTRLRFIAFLVDHEGMFQPHIQGFAVSCDHRAAAVPVFDPIPGTEGMTIDEIDDAVEAVTNPPTPTANVVTIPHRLLAEDLVYGNASTTARLTAEQVWEVAPEAEVDVDNEVFLEFNVAESGTCPNGPLDRIDYNPDTARLYPVLEPQDYDACTDDANPHVIIVAITRRDLPAEAFTATTGADDDVGSYASFEPGELRSPDPETLEHRVLRESSSLAVGETGILLDVTTHCGFDRLGQLVDSGQWVLTDESITAGVPSSWDDVTRGERIDLVVERTADDLLVVTARGTDDSLEYRPADDDAGCD